MSPKVESGTGGDKITVTIPKCDFPNFVPSEVPPDFRGILLASLLKFWFHEVGEDYIYWKGRGGASKLNWATGGGPQGSLAQELKPICSFIHKIESYNV